MTPSRLQSVSRELPVLIAGPTASGKSALAMEIAARDGRAVVNADALQVYDCWRVLSARPSAADEAALPHALYGHIAHDAAYSVGHWLREVTSWLDRPVVIVGGTGLYFTALTEGLAVVPDIPPAVRAEADAMRLADLDAMRAGLDAETAARIDLANPARIQRAWEVLRSTGRGLAEWQRQTAPPLLPRAKAHALVLRPDVAWLDARIAHRFSVMLEDGALPEVEAQLPLWSAERPSSRAIGATELREHLLGRMTLQAATQAATLATRQYAKRQRTWFRSRMRDWDEYSLT